MATITAKNLLATMTLPNSTTSAELPFNTRKDDVAEILFQEFIVKGAMSITKVTVQNHVRINDYTWEVQPNTGWVWDVTRNGSKVTFVAKTPNANSYEFEIPAPMAPVQTPVSQAQSFEAFNNVMANTTGPVALTAQGIAPAATTTTTQEATTMQNTNTQDVIAQLQAALAAKDQQIEELKNIANQALAAAQAAAANTAVPAPAAPAKAPVAESNTTKEENITMIDALTKTISAKSKTLVDMICAGKANTEEYKALKAEIEGMEAELAEKKKAQNLMSRTEKSLSQVADSIERGVKYADQKAGDLAEVATSRMEKAAPHLINVGTVTAGLGIGSARVVVNTVATVGNTVLDAAESLVNPVAKGAITGVTEVGSLFRSLFGR